MVFMYLFLAVDRFGDGSFFGEPETSTGFMYFSLVTITTLGYGDLVPASDVGRAVATSAAMLGYLVFIVARLVALYTSSGSVIGRSSRDSRNADLGPEREVFGDDNGSVLR